MRLGAPIYERFSDPESWVKAVQVAGYRAAYCPVDVNASAETVRAYAEAARDADIIIAEVGAWSNPLSPEDSIRREALEKCKKALQLAERIGARCCVNIAGSRGERWDGPAAADLTVDTFDMIVQTVREIIDAVQPTRTYYTLEPMPWMYPDSPDSYLELLHAVERPQFGVHLDPVNMINSPARYYHNDAFLRECFAKLGKYIRSCHAKDTLLQPRLTTHLDEVRPGAGVLDYRVYLREAHRADPDMPVLVEHLSNEEEYRLAVQYIRGVAAAEQIPC